MREPSSDDSIPGAEHTPPEAKIIVPAYIVSQPTATPWPNVNCQQADSPLHMELIEGVPNDLKAAVQTSPSGRYIAVNQYGENQLILLDQMTGERRDFTAPGVAFFWTDDLHLFVIDEDWYSINVENGQITYFESRWEYNQPDISRFTRDVYTGWQAANALQVDNTVICRAFQDGILNPIPASDGTLLLRRDELLELGGDIVRAEYKEMLTSQEVTTLRESAQNAVVVGRYWIDTPMEFGYANKTWQRLLILTGLPTDPKNLIIHVASEAHWSNYPYIPNDERIVGGAIQGRDRHPDFLVSTDLCNSELDKVHILYQKDHDSEMLTALGSISFNEYTLYNQESNDSRMFWSADGRSIYISEWADGYFSIHRLQLPSSE